MSTLATAMLQKRAFRLDDNEDLSGSGIWYENDPWTTHLLNAYTLLIPSGERFIMRASSRWMNAASPELREDLKTLFFQEGSHSREHARIVAAMKVEGLALTKPVALIEWLSYRVVEPIAPSKLRLATAAAIEHHNAAIASRKYGIG